MGHLSVVLTVSHGGSAGPSSLSRGTGDPLNSLQLRLCRTEVIGSGVVGRQRLLCLCFIQMVRVVTHPVSPSFPSEPGRRLGVVSD